MLVKSVCAWQKFEFETEPRAQCLIKTKYMYNIYKVCAHY